MRPSAKRLCAEGNLGEVPDPDTLVGTVTLLKGFADETRLHLLSLRRGGEVCVHDLVESLDISRSGEYATSCAPCGTHACVKSRKEGRHVYHLLANEHVRELLENALSHGAEAALLDPDNDLPPPLRRYPYPVAPACSGETTASVPRVR